MKKLLIANRGEIALRIIHAAQELGVKTVAVYSEEDAESLHAKAADEAYLIGPAPSQESYLRTDKLLGVCNQTGADAVHPGYGFLSEKADFAEAVEKAGIRFVGPSPKVIEEMGDKVKARALMEKAGVPIVPGTSGITDVKQGEKDVLKLLKARKDFRFPLLIKAAGGGGGKGMRIVREEKELREQLERAQSESIKAFNNDMLFVERYIEEPRHIEVQVLGDGKNVLCVGDRECSLQRRHQKVIEEAPSPSITAEQRQAMFDVSTKAAASLKYTSAGTIEFIVSPEGDFYFLEMNTRIQVEHPVTEETTGIDLVKEQLLIAQGQALSVKQEELQTQGHAIEARLYAEDCDHEFLPQPGQLQFLRFPQRKGLRVDSGIESPAKISSFYDPMIAKIIAWGEDRETARKKLYRFLGEIHLEGLITNRAFLLEVLHSDYFKKGRYHTHTLESKDWRNKPKAPARVMAALCLKEYLDQRLDLDRNKRTVWQVAE